MDTHRETKSNAPEPPFLHGLIASGVRLLGNLKSHVGIALQGTFAEGMQRDATVQERIASLRLLLLGLADSMP